MGFKNGTSGDTGIAIDACRAASHPHHFLGLTSQSLAAIVSTTGNPECHVILRGGSDGPNYHKKDVQALKEKLRGLKLPERVIIDCSHGNSSKKHSNQPIVAADIGAQVAEGEKCITGIMLESHLVEGRQDLVAGKSLEYGKSVTDACVSFETTVEVLRGLSESVNLRAKACN